jgi:CheY-like chemotaxis protein
MEETRRVLVVEDREDHQKIFKDIVESMQCKPEIVATVEESVGKLARISFHVALVDLSLDDKDPDNRDGFKVLAHIKAIDEGTKPIVLTAYGEVEDSSEAFREYGVFDFIRKDRMQVSEVKEKIRTAAEKARLEMVRPARQPQDVTGLIKGQSVSRLLEVCESTSGELELFLSRLLSKMYPLLPAKQDATEYQPEDMSLTVQARFWSKALGKPVVAWFGKLDEMKTAVRAMDESAASMQKAGYDEKVNEVFDAQSFPHLGGAIYTLKDVPFEEFESRSYLTNSVSNQRERGAKRSQK